MPTKHTLERNVRVASRRCYKYIRNFKYPLFVVLLGILTYLMLQDPTSERITMYIFSIIAIFFAFKQDNVLKEKNKKKKTNNV